MGIILIFLSALFNVVQSALSKFSSTGGRTTNPATFNLFKSLGSFVLFALISVWGFKWHLPTVAYALFYGIFMLSSNVFGNGKLYFPLPFRNN